tara:strand:- start:1980 stop:2249 length:270 start_codon:yes stop_codon:yes gene_type:complete
MQSKKDIEREIIENFNIFHRKILTSEAKKYNGKLDEVRYVFYFHDKECSFSPPIIDYAIWNFKKKEFTKLLYPWRKKNGELKYNVIKLK